MLNQMARRRRIGLSWVGSYRTNEYVILEDPDLSLSRGPNVEIPYTPEAGRALADAGYVEIFAKGGWHVWRHPAGGPPANPRSEAP
jgi:hypothetical protein